DQVTAALGRSGRDAVTLPDGCAVALLRLDEPAAAAIGDRFVLRQPPPAGLLAGGLVIDAQPPRGRSRRRQTPARLERLADSVTARQDMATIRALVDLAGHLGLANGPSLAADVRDLAIETALRSARAHQSAHPSDPGMPMPALRALVAAAIRASATVSADDAAAAAGDLIDGLSVEGRLARVADVAHTPEHRPSEPNPDRARAMDRLVALLDVDAPPTLSAAARDAGCPVDAVRELERAGRVVIIDDDLAWSVDAFARLRGTALALAEVAPLTPAMLRDATGTSRRYVMALLEELDRRAVLRRTPAGHVPGPRSQGPLPD
ncbi:MAG: SelB C-terminal domain-containing protein, partial [Candidatus Limnocylindrales bacterium]